MSTGHVAAACALSDEDIEVGGPRGSGRGHQIVRDWVARTGIALERLRIFHGGSVAVLEQRATWKLGDAGESTKVIGTVFKVSGERVVSVVRYNSLEEALAAAGLTVRSEYSCLGPSGRP